MRIRLFGLAAVIGLFGFFAPSADALLIGDLSGNEPDTLLITGTSDVHPVISRVNSTVIEPLATTITTDGGATDYGGWLYFTNSAGFWKQDFGTSTATRIKASTTMRLAGASGKWMIVSNSSNRGSYLYSGQTGASWIFAPKVREITQANFFGSGKVAILGKNAAGKQKLFFTRGGSRHQLDEVNLPRYAKRCDGMKVSGNGQKIFLACTFNIPGQGNNLKGYVISELTRPNLISARRIINGLEYSDITWIGNNKLLTLEVDEGGLTQMVLREITGSKVTSSEVVGFDAEITYNDRPAILSPLDVEPNSTWGFYYTYIVQYLDGQSPYIGPSLLGLYDFASETDTILSDDGTFRYYTN